MCSHILGEIRRMCDATIDAPLMHKFHGNQPHYLEPFVQIFKDWRVGNLIDAMHRDDSYVPSVLYTLPLPELHSCIRFPNESPRSPQPFLHETSQKHVDVLSSVQACTDIFVHVPRQKNVEIRSWLTILGTLIALLKILFTMCSVTCS